MKPVSLVTAGALALATAVLTIAPVVPAFAAELPETDSIYSIADLEAHAQLLGINPMSAEATAIGTGADSWPHDEDDLLYSESQGGAHDPVSGDAYFIQFVVYDDGGDALEWWLGRTDLATGETETVDRFYLPEYDDLPVITAIAIQPDGDAYAIGGPAAGECGCDVEEFYLFELDLDDATLDLVSETPGPEDEWFTAFAANPMTGELVAVGIDSGTVYTVDPDNGEFTGVDTPNWEGAVESWNVVVALAFDSTGNPWLVIYDDYGFAVLVKNGGDGPEAVGSINVDSDDIETKSLVIDWGGGDSEPPAQPTTANGKLFAISWDDQYNAFQLFAVDPATGLSTPVGTGNGEPGGDDSAGFQPAYDATTHTVYYIADLDTSDSDDGLVLARINTTTGITTMGPEFSLDSETLTLGELHAMAIGPDGAAYVIGDVNDEEEGYRYLLFSLNLASAELTVIADLVLDEESGGYLPIGAFTADPTTGIFYAMSRDESELFEVDVESGHADFVAGIGIDSFQSGSYVLSLQIDQAGRFWMLSDSQLDPDGEEGPIDGGWWVYLSSFTLDDDLDYIVAVEAGMLWDDPYYTSALIFLPTLAAGPSLAATGVEAGAIGAGGAAVLLLLLGGVGIIVARRRAASR